MKKEESEKDATEEAKNIIAKSGNRLHSKVIKILKDEGWHTLVSPYYNDNYTDKPREIDIIAGKNFPISKFAGHLYCGDVVTSLFIECKYISDTTIFWLNDKDSFNSIKLAIHNTGLPDPEKNTTIRTHHYLNPERVAKLYASNSKKGEDNETIGKAINQCLNAFNYYRSNTAKTDEKAGKTLRRLSYPMIIADSFEKVFAVNIEDENEELKKITDPIQIEVNYAFTGIDGKHKNEFFLIDIVSLEQLPEFLSRLAKSDIRPTGEYFAR